MIIDFGGAPTDDTSALGLQLPWRRFALSDQQILKKMIHQRTRCVHVKLHLIHHDVGYNHCACATTVT